MKAETDMFLSVVVQRDDSHDALRSLRQTLNPQPSTLNRVRKARTHASTIIHRHTTTTVVE